MAPNYKELFGKLEESFKQFNEFTDDVFEQTFLTQKKLFFQQLSDNE